MANFAPIFLKKTLLKRLQYILLFFISFNGFAQQYPTIEYNTRDGLAQMQVMTVFEDSRGYIWAASKGGLSKFDGENFENFLISDGLQNNSIDYITEDSEHTIWLKYGDDGYGKFDGQKFTNFKLPKVIPSYIVEYKNRMIFSRSDSLFCIEKDKIKFKNKLPFVNPKSAFGIQFLAEKQTGLLYAVYYNSLNAQTSIFYFDEKTKQYIPFHYFQNESISLHVIRDKILIISYHGDIEDFYLLKNKQLSKYFTLSPTQTTFTAYPDFDFNFKYYGKSWIYSKDDKKIAQVASTQGAGTTTSNRATASQKLYTGTEKGLVCTYLNGFKYFKETEVPYAWGVVEDAEKNIWMSSYQSPLQKFDGKKLQTITQYYDLLNKKVPRPQKQNLGHLNSWYFNPLKDKHNKLWFPRFNGALIVDKGKFFYLHPKQDSVFFFNQTEDPKRNKIIGCGEGGIGVFENQLPYKHQFIKDTGAMFQKKRLILTAAIDAQGNYWLGGRYIAKYNPDTKQFKYYADYNQKLAKQGVGNIVIDNRGGIWAGMMQDGLMKYNPKTDKFDFVFQKYLAQNTLCNYLGQINDNYFVIADNLNLFIIDLDELYLHGKEKVVKVLNYHNGFLGIEPGQDGFFKDSEGKIWVTSGSVLSYFDPKKLNFQPSPLRTFIRSINNQKLPFDYENSPTIELEEDKNEVKIAVESVGEDKTANAEFSYRIKGFREDWSDWQMDRAIYLTNMPSGNFTIEVRSKRNLLEDKDYPITYLKFSINIPFWKSPDFYKYAFLLGLFLLAIVGVILYRNFTQSKKIQKQKRLGEEQENQMNLLQIQTTQAQLNPHFIFNVLMTLQGQI